MSALFSRLFINVNEMLNKDVRVGPHSNPGTQIPQSLGTEDMGTLRFASHRTGDTTGH